ncbi:HET-domain-containing protein, partial [Byssothecium circinans]
MEKFHECCDTHSACGLPTSSPVLYPTRLIDVGKTDDEHIRLYDTHDFVYHGPYFCLSHCWGETQPYILTKETAAALRSGLHTNELPRTFQDAIHVTRKFQVRYLWIDSLCIFQDNIEDWSTEARNMQKVYSGAICTIAATAATNHGEGLFFARKPEFIRPRWINTTWSPKAISKDGNHDSKLRYPPAGMYLFENTDLWVEGVEETPLNMRAWVAQERHLSTRIMHFGAFQLFWECRKIKACESYPKILPSWLSPHWSHVGDAGNDAATSLKQWPWGHLDRLYWSWMTFRIHYSMGAMTKESDKLVALMGVAEEVGQVLGDELVAGLWRKRFLVELCWSVFRNTYEPIFEPVPLKPTKWRAPTWSWVSTNNQDWLDISS